MKLYFKTWIWALQLLMELKATILGQESIALFFLSYQIHLSANCNENYLKGTNSTNMFERPGSVETGWQMTELSSRFI